MSHIYTDAEATFCGVPFPIVERAAILGGSLSNARTISMPRASVTYSCTGSIQIPCDTLDRLIDMLTPRTTGASDMTLARRVAYGGRKGRSAMRRLWAKGFVGILRVNDERPIPSPPITINAGERTIVLRGRRR